MQLIDPWDGAPGSALGRVCPLVPARFLATACLAATIFFVAEWSPRGAAGLRDPEAASTIAAALPIASQAVLRGLPPAMESLGDYDHLHGDRCDRVASSPPWDVSPAVAVKSAGF